MYLRMTKGIMIEVDPVFVENGSSEGCYRWRYNITIANKGKSTVQLLHRYWVITDKYGDVQTIDGKGVVGKQPVLKPGEVFTYTSNVILKADSGFMRGYYQMVEGEESFMAQVPIFPLDRPDVVPKYLN